MRRVVVTGMGAITPLGLNVKSILIILKLEIMDLESFPSLMLQNTKHMWLQK